LDILQAKCPEGEGQETRVNPSGRAKRSKHTIYPNPQALITKPYSNRKRLALSHRWGLPEGQSAFLWGARQTGKSSYLASHFPKAIVYDLLDTHQLIRLTKSPWLLREEVNALSKQELKHPIIIDEIQKVPTLLNEVHWLIEHLQAQFILCGSSERKLKMDAANLLGGRAWKYHFYPLVSAEIPGGRPVDQK
jgi:predicted AAA+ superfamily ATPase